jgi:hypothetical protein
MRAVLAIDFEAVTTKERAKSYNTQHSVPVEIGLYNVKSKEKFTSQIRPTLPIFMQKWHQENTPHITEESLKSAKDKNEVAKKTLEFLKENCIGKDHSDKMDDFKNSPCGCDILMYGQADYKWFHTLFEDSSSMKSLEETFNIEQQNFFSSNSDNSKKPKLNFIDVKLHFVDKYDFDQKSGSLKYMYDITFPEFKGKLKNHNACDDAVMLGEMYEKRYLDKKV